MTGQREWTAGEAVDQYLLDLLAGALGCGGILKLDVAKAFAVSGFLQPREPVSGCRSSVSHLLELVGPIDSAMHVCSAPD